MFKPSTLFLAAACCSSPSWAQVAPRTAVPTTFVELPTKQAAVALAAAPQVLAKQLALQASESFVHLRTEKGLRGDRHARYAQYYRGIPVEGGEYLVHERMAELSASTASTGLFARSTRPPL